MHKANGLIATLVAAQFLFVSLAPPAFAARRRVVRKAAPRRTARRAPAKRAPAKRAPAKRAPARRAPAARRPQSAAQRRAQAIKLLKTAFSKFKVRGFKGLAAKLSRRTTRATLGSLSANVGKLVEMSGIVSEIRKAEEKGEAPTGSSLLRDYDRWMEAKARKEKVSEHPPGDLREDKTSYEKFQQGYIKKLIPDLKAYVPFIYDHVFTAVSRDFQPSSKDERVTLLYQYACKQVSRLMPGFAKIVKKVISGGGRLNLVDDWDASIDRETLAQLKPKEGSDKAPKKPKPYTPPPKPEIIEVCSITHLQLEKTLVRDLGYFVDAVRAGSRPGADDEILTPLSGFPGFLASGGSSRSSSYGSPRVVRPARAPKPRVVRPARPARRKPAPKKRRTRRRSALDGFRGARVADAGGAGRRSAQSACARRPAPRRVRPARPAPSGGKITIIEGTYGRNCNNKLRVGNSTSHLGRACNGKPSCNYKISFAPFRNRDPGGRMFCTRNFVAKWHCGDRKTQSRTLPGEAKGKTLGISCGKSGFAGLPGNLAAVIQRGVAKAKRANAKRATAARSSGPKRGIQIISASYGNNCVGKGGICGKTGRFDANIAKRHLQAACGGKQRCSYKVTHSPWGKDVQHKGICGTYGCTREYRFKYHCGDPSKPQPEGYQRGEAHNKTVTLDCQEDIRLGAARDRAQAEQKRRHAQQVALDKRLRSVHQELFRDIGKHYNIDELTGETFHEIAKRLLSFYRGAGGARNFDRAIRASAGDVKKMAQSVSKTHAPGPAQKEIKHHAGGNVVDTRGRREMLRRKVDQWTHGYEYEQLTGSLKAKSGRLLSDYKKSEAAVIEEFFRDCEELQAICQGPKTKSEKTACVLCAEQAFRSHCVAGKEKSRCKGDTKAQVIENLNRAFQDGALVKDYEKKFVSTRTTKEWPTGNTFFNWLALKVIAEARNVSLYQGTVANNASAFKASIIRNLVERIFLPRETDADKGLSTEGKDFLDAMPVTSWQRCVLWNPFYPRDNSVCDKQDGKGMDSLKGKAHKGMISWHQAKLFQMVLDDPIVAQDISEVTRFWGSECRRKKSVAKGGIQIFGWRPFGSKTVSAVNCSDLGKKARIAADEFFKRGGAAKNLGMNRDGDLKKAGGAIADAIGPIVGKLLGMLLKAAGMYEAMKTIARAAGMTPEQSANCEDGEYRRDIMKMDPKKTTKRDCLMKVFAKNFTTVLESIIIMLGNKLVDWGVDLLRTLLQPVKSALIAAAGSVPFAGGVLATIVDIGWELLMNFGAKMLLKGFVVSKLPEWLKIRELSQQSIEKVLSHPIVSVVAGIILYLIESAMLHGDKSWMAVGVDTALTVIQKIIQGKAEKGDKDAQFWMRALIYAKRELAKEPPVGDDIGAQLKSVAVAMIGGFGAAIGRRLEGDVRAQFDTAVSDIQQAIRTGFNQSDFQRDPLGALVNFVGTKIAPVVMPVVASMLPVPDWAKELLVRVGNGLKVVLEKIKANQFSVKLLVGQVVTISEPVWKHFLDKLPISDFALKDMIKKGIEKLANVLKDIDQIERNYLSNPWRIVEGLVEVTGDFLKAKVGELIKDPKLNHEKTLVENAVGKVLGILGEERVRNQLFPRGSLNVQALLGEIAGLLQPYVTGRLGELTQGTGLERLLAKVLDLIFGAQGPFRTGAAFFRNLPSVLNTQGRAIAGEALAAVGGIVTKEAQKLGGGPIVSGLVQGVLGAVRKAIEQPQRLTNAAGVLGLLKDAFQPLLTSIVPTGPPGGQASALSGLLQNILGGVLDLFANPANLTQLASRGPQILASLAGRVANGLRDTVKSLVGRVIPDTALRGLTDRAIDRVFGLLSNPTQLGQMGGQQILNLVKEIGEGLFNYVKDKVLAVFRASQASPLQAALQGILNGVVAEVMRLIQNPSELQSLVSGGADKILGLVVRILRGPVDGLIDAAVPQAVRAAVKTVAGELFGFLANPASITRLGSMSAGDVISKLAPIAQQLLTGVLRSAVPAGAFAAIQTAIGQIQAALANPAGLAAAAGQAARQAIDQVVAAALVQISDPVLRDLASNLVALVRDLVSTGGTSLRTNVQGILRRLADAGVRFLSGLIPAGPVRELVGEVAGVVAGLFQHSGGLAQALRQQAQALLPRVTGAVEALLRGALTRAIPDPAVSGLVTSLVGEVLGFIGDSSRWQQLRSGGVGFVFSRLLPIGRDFAMAMLGRVQGTVGDVLRGVVQSLLGAAGQLFSGGPQALARFAQNAVSSLISMGIGAVKPAVLNLVQRATGSEAISRFLGTAFDGLSEVLADPAKLGQYLRLSAKDALKRLLQQAKPALARLVGDVVKSDDFKRIAQEGLKGLLDLVETAIGGGNIGEGVKRMVVQVIPAVVGLAKTKLLGLFPHHLAGLKAVASFAFDELVGFAMNLIQRGQAAWDQLLRSGGQLLGKLVGAVMPLVKGPIEQAVKFKPLRGLLTRLLDQVTDLLKDPAALIRKFANATTAMRELLPKLEKVIGPFAKELLVDPIPAGLPRNIVGKIVEKGRELLAKPEKIQALTRQQDFKATIRALIDELGPALLGALPGGRGGALYNIFKAGLDLLVSQALGGGGARR